MIESFVIVMGPFYDRGFSPVAFNFFSLFQKKFKVKYVKNCSFLDVACLVFKLLLYVNDHKGFLLYFENACHILLDIMLFPLLCPSFLVPLGYKFNLLFW